MEAHKTSALRSLFCIKHSKTIPTAGAPDFDWRVSVFRSPAPNYIQLTPQRKLLRIL